MASAGAAGTWAPTPQPFGPPVCNGVRVQGLGLRVEGLGFRVQALGFGVQGLRGLGFRV